MPTNETKKIALAVCTRDRPVMLSRCINSLCALNLTPAIHLELVVIDNSGGLHAPDEIQRLCQGKATLLSEPLAGIPFARNQALEYALASSKDALIFLDDDQVVPSDWLNVMVRTWIQEEAQVVKSFVNWDFEVNSEYIYFFKETRPNEKNKMKPGDSIATNGVLIDRIVFRDWGLKFSTRHPLLGGTDSLFFKNCEEKGAKILITYETEAIETCPAKQLTLRWLLRRRFRVGAATALLDIKKRGNFYYAVYGFTALCINVVGVLINAFTRKNRTKRLLKAAKFLGMICGALGIGLNEYKNVTGS